MAVSESRIVQVLVDDLWMYAESSRWC
jgi:hypothetical protein